MRRLRWDAPLIRLSAVVKSGHQDERGGYVARLVSWRIGLLGEVW
jgi:hypothetical protein